jgi:hypothetical protein
MNSNHLKIQRRGVDIILTYKDLGYNPLNFR